MRPKLSCRSVNPTAPRASRRLKMWESLRMWSYAGTGSRCSSSLSVSCTAPPPVCGPSGQPYCGPQVVRAVQEAHKAHKAHKPKHASTMWCGGLRAEALMEVVLDAPQPRPACMLACHTAAGAQATPWRSRAQLPLLAALPVLVRRARRPAPATHGLSRRHHRPPQVTKHASTQALLRAARCGAGAGQVRGTGHASAAGVRAGSSAHRLR